MFVLEGSPAHEPLPVCSKGAKSGIDTIGNALLIRLQLLKGSPNVSLFISGILEFDYRYGQAVYEDYNIGAAGLFGTEDGELINHQKLVFLVRKNQ